MHVLRGHQASRVTVAQAHQVVLLSLERGVLGLGVGQLAEAPAQVAVDAVFGDAPAHQFHRVDAGTLQVFESFLADVTGKAADLMADATDQLPAVAPAGAPADAPGLQEDHRQPALGQLDSGIDPGEAAADHADIGVQVAFQGRVAGQGADRGGVVGGGVPVGAAQGQWLVHLLDFTLLHERVMTRMIAGEGVLAMYSLSSTSLGG